MYSRWAIRQHRIKASCWSTLVSTTLIRESRHAVELIFIARMRLLRRSVIKAWFWILHCRRHSRNQSERFRRGRVLQLFCKMWDAWVQTHRRQKLYVHSFEIIERGLRCRRKALLQTALLELWLLHQCTVACREQAKYRAQARARPLCRHVWQRWWWVRWRRHRHLAGLQTMYFWVLKKEDDLIQVAFHCFKGLLCLHLRRDVAEKINTTSST